MRLIAAITNTPSIECILIHIGEPRRPPPVTPARGPPESEWDFNQRPVGEVTETIPDYQFDLGNCSRHCSTSHFPVVERVSC